MKQIEVVAAVICHNGKFFATQRGYGEFKDFWEFPGGKLDTEISVDTFLTTVEYPYPAFHLTMHCFFCSVRSGHLELKEHENAAWLQLEELDNVNWLPADVEVVKAIKNH